MTLPSRLWISNRYSDATPAIIAPERDITHSREGANGMLMVIVPPVGKWCTNTYGSKASSGTGM